MALEWAVYESVFPLGSEILQDKNNILFLLLYSLLNKMSLCTYSYFLSMANGEHCAECYLIISRDSPDDNKLVQLEW